MDYLHDTRGFYKENCCNVRDVRVMLLLAETTVYVDVCGKLGFRVTVSAI